MKWEEVATKKWLLSKELNGGFCVYEEKNVINVYQSLICPQPGEESDYLTEYEDEGMDAVREEEGQELLFAPAEQNAVFETVSPL